MSNGLKINLASYIDGPDEKEDFEVEIFTLDNIKPLKIDGKVGLLFIPFQ